MLTCRFFKIFTKLQNWNRIVLTTPVLLLEEPASQCAALRIVDSTCLKLCINTKPSLPEKNLYIQYLSLCIISGASHAKNVEIGVI